MTATPGLFIRLYLDVNIHLWLAKDLVAHGYDAVHALEAGHERWTVRHRLMNLLDHVTADEMVNDVRWLDDQWS